MNHGQRDRPLLPPTQWLEIVRHTPLISIDLIVQDIEGRILLGLRNNEPARGSWFVPGGVVKKNESLDDAFARITETEIGASFSRRTATFRGIFEHLYPENFAQAPEVTTHYVVLAYIVQTDQLPTRPGDSQHGNFCGFTAAELLSHPDVHDNTKAYFR
jgi:colanic acid biosynthesis protein WcaH